MAVLGRGMNRVPFVVVEELADAVVRATEGDHATGHAYNLSGSAPVTQTEFLAMCSRATGSPMPRRHVPVPAARLAASWAEWIHRVRRRHGAPEISRLGVSVAASDLVVDCSAAARDLGWMGAASYESAVERGTAWLASRAEAASS
jgi:nucleoside-diphosphate-sugar epimerase